jgi:predicted RNA-binding protein YlxR (DUF448 family)
MVIKKAARISFIPQMSDVETQTDQKEYQSHAYIETEKVETLDVATMTPKNFDFDSPDHTIISPRTRENTFVRKEQDIGDKSNKSNKSSDSSFDSVMGGSTNRFLPDNIPALVENLENLLSEEETDIDKSLIPDIENFISKARPVKASGFYHRHHNKRDNNKSFGDPDDEENAFSPSVSRKASPPESRPQSRAGDESPSNSRIVHQVSELLEVYKTVCKERDQLKTLVKTVGRKKLVRKMSKLMLPSALLPLLQPTVSILPSKNSKIPNIESVESEENSPAQKLLRVRKSNAGLLPTTIKNSSRNIAVMSSRGIDVKVVKQAKERKDQQIQLANQMMNNFLNNTQKYISDKNITHWPLKSTVREANKIYSQFIADVERKTAHLTVRLFIYAHRRFEYATGAIGGDQFKRMLKSLVVHCTANYRIALFAALMGLKNSLDVASFQIFYEIVKFIKDRQ